MTRSSDISISFPIMNMKYNLAENFVQNEESPSLENVTVTNIAILMCKRFFLGVSKSHISVISNPMKCLFFLRRDWNNYLKEIFNKGFSDFILTLYCKDELIKVISVTGSQLLIFLESLGKLKLTFNFERIEIYLNNLYWTLQGTLDYIKIASTLVENSKLNEIEKYILACHFCLEIKVNDILQILPNEFINDFEDDEQLYMMKFWTYKIKRDFEKFNKIFKGHYYGNHFDNFWSYLLAMAIKDSNEVAVQYIWKIVSHSKENIEGLVQFAFDLNSTNVGCYLLSQIREKEDLDHLCKLFGYAILKNLASSKRWNKYFLISWRYVIQFIRDMNFCSPLKTILLCIKENVLEHRELDITEEFENEYNKDLENLFKNKIMQYVVLCIDDKIMIKKILRIERIEEWNIFHFDDNNRMNLYKDLILKKEVDLFQKLTDILKERNNFYAKFLKKKSIEICEYFILNNDYFVFDKFLKIICGDNVNNFKENVLPYKGKGKIIGNILRKQRGYFSQNKEIIIDVFLNWCFENKAKKIALCKTILFGQDKGCTFCKENFYQNIYLLYERRDMHNLKSLLKWAYETEENIRTV